ncbi:MAG: hypothetical protein DMF78_15250 [Acidobacteria bacterium]|nr:MAG: hypothetical protein DMF78_15250 [Acidobacteriota bacterium]
MASEWTTVDTFVRDLGVLRAAAVRVRASAAAKAAIETAIREAAQAIDLTIDAPMNRERLDGAGAALQVASEVIVALDREIARSFRLRANASSLCERARQLIAQAGA